MELEFQISNRPNLNIDEYREKHNGYPYTLVNVQLANV